MNSFENWLETTKFAESYNGSDDNLREAFDAWLDSLQVDVWLLFGQEYAQDYADLKK